MYLIQNTPRSQVSAGLENVTSKETIAQRLPSTEEVTEVSDNRSGGRNSGDGVLSSS